MVYPKSFQALIDALQVLPGVGLKTAERYAFALLNSPSNVRESLANSLYDIENINHCQFCGNLCDSEICTVCSDETRNHQLCCVVSSSKDLLAIENAGVYQGVYHVLNGVISASKGIYPQDIGLDALFKRIETTQIKEIVVATPLTMDGEMTALYISNKLKSTDALVTRIAKGLPMGGQIDYADSTTLKQAFQGRKKVEQE